MYILCIMSKIIAFFIILLFIRLYVRVGNLLTRVKSLHDSIISLRGTVQAHETSCSSSCVPYVASFSGLSIFDCPFGILQVSVQLFTLPLFIKVPVPSRESERSCICIQGVSILFFYDFDICFCNCSTSMIFLVFHFINRNDRSKTSCLLQCNSVMC